MAHGWTDAVGAQVPAGVHAVGRVAHGVGHLDVGGREAEQPAALVARRRPSRGLVQVAEQPGGHVDLTTGQCPADGGGADGLVDAVGALDQASPARPRSRAPGPADAARRRCPPGGGRSGSPRRSRRPSWRRADDQHLLHEVVGRLLGSGLVEGRARPWRRGRSRPAAPASVGRSVSSRGADSGRTTLAGWRSKVTTDAACAVGVGQAADLGDDGGVAEVDPVEGADGDDRALAWPGGTAEVVDDLHGCDATSRHGLPACSRLPCHAPTSTTAGLDPPSHASYTARRVPSAASSAHGPGPGQAASGRPWRDQRWPWPRRR